MNVHFGRVSAEVAEYLANVSGQADHTLGFQPSNYNPFRLSHLFQLKEGRYLTGEKSRKHVQVSLESD